MYGSTTHVTLWDSKTRSGLFFLYSLDLLLSAVLMAGRMQYYRYGGGKTGGDGCDATNIILGSVEIESVSASV